MVLCLLFPTIFLLFLFHFFGITQVKVTDPLVGLIIDIVFDLAGFIFCFFLIDSDCLKDLCQQFMPGINALGDLPAFICQCDESVDIHADIAVLTKFFLMSYFFLVCGYVLCRIFTEDSLPTAFISLVLFIGGNVLSTVRLDMHNAVYGNAVLMIPTAFAGTWLLFFLCRRLRSFLPLEAIGQHSMAIMGTHMPLLEIAHRLASSNKAVLLIAALLEIPTVLTARLIFPFLRGKGVHR